MERGSWACSSIMRFSMILILAIKFFCQCYAQSPAALDALLQDYAYRAFHNPHTGTVYDGQAPSNLTGVRISVVRLRSGSLRSRGMARYREFEIPRGVSVEPFVERMVFVYQNIGNWSEVYYPLPGYEYVAPVLGLLAYDAANLSGTGLKELDVRVSNKPISINFKDVMKVPSGLSPQCVWFKLNGLREFTEMVSGGVCSTEGQGHFSVVVNSSVLAPAPAPGGGVVPGPAPGKSHKSKSKTWKIVGGVVGGVVVLVLAALLLGCLLRYLRKKRVAGMERQADAGENLRMARVGNAQGPVASGSRTQPVIEN